MTQPTKPATPRQPRFRVGSVVTVRGSHGRKAVIVAEYSDIKGGVILDRKVLGFRSWNKQDLRPFKSRSRDDRRD